MRMHDSVRCCLYCKAQLPQKDRGRYREYCSAAHRSAARRRRLTATAPARQEEPFARALSDAREASALSLRRLSAVLDERGHYISMSALSQWERGRTLPHRTPDGQHEVLALEGALDLPPGGLVKPFVLTHEQRRLASGRLAGATASRGRGRNGRQPAAAGPAARMRSLLERLQREHGVDRSLLFLVEQREQLTIGRWQRPESAEMRHTVGAAGDQIAAYWYPHCYPAAEPATVHAVEGCTVGRTFTDSDLVPDADRVVAVTELRFDAPVRLGDTKQFAYRLEHFPSEDSAAPRVHDFKRVLTSPACRLLEMSVSFHPMATPRRLVRGTWPKSDPGGQPVEQTDLGAESYGEIAEEPPKPMTYGWIWEW
jgi:transcriptional regulator with XRE-family HTH domain